MKKGTQLRIVNDILNFNKNKPDDIYINFDKNNFTKIFALIIGPKNTPYETSQTTRNC